LFLAIEGKPVKLERSRVARIVLVERKPAGKPAARTGKSPSRSTK
jgi:hypothetical protein